MSRFKLSPEAASDIREIWTYIVADNPVRPLMRGVRIPDGSGGGHKVRKPPGLHPAASCLLSCTGSLRLFPALLAFLAFAHRFEAFLAALGAVGGALD